LSYRRLKANFITPS